MKNNEQKSTKKFTTNTFVNNEHVLPDHPFPKGTCLIVGDSVLAGINENCLKTGDYKVKLRFFAGARTDDIYDYMKPLLWTGLHYLAHCNK